MARQAAQRGECLAESARFDVLGSKVYVPELVFGHLLTSDNYDDTSCKVQADRRKSGAEVLLFLLECIIALVQECNLPGGGRSEWLWRQACQRFLHRVQSGDVRRQKQAELALLSREHTSSHTAS